MDSRIAVRHGAHRHSAYHTTRGWSNRSAGIDARVVVAVVGILFGAMAIGAALSLYRLLGPPQRPPVPWSARVARDATRVPEALPSREARVYPYSIVPGGVRDGADVARAMARDTVVATHYARVRVASLRRVRLARAREVSVSYRVGDRVYWTRKTARLEAGEEVLTDGTTEIRPRCGNCIAARPPGETREDEPSISTLDAPIVPAGEPAGSPLRDPLTAYEFLAGPSSWALLAAPAAREGEWPRPELPGLPGGAGPGFPEVTVIDVAGGLPADTAGEGGWSDTPGEPGAGDAPGGGDPGGAGDGGGGAGGSDGGSGGGPGGGSGGRGDTGGDGPERVPEPAGLLLIGLAAAWRATRRRCR